MTPENEKQVVDAINTMNQRLLKVEGYAKGLELALGALAKAISGAGLLNRKDIDVEIDAAIAAVDSVEADEPTRVFLAAARSLLEDAKARRSSAPSLHLIHGGKHEDGE